MKKTLRFLPLLAAVLTLFQQRAGAQPTITVQPVGATNATVGSTVNFSVTATAAAGSLVYQWQRNGVAIPTATSSAFSIGNVQATNCGTISVVVGDNTGFVASSSVGLTVNLTVHGGNNLMNGAFALTPVLGGVIRSSNNLATVDSDDPVIIPTDPGGASIWFSWTPTANGIVTFSTLGSSFDTIMGNNNSSVFIIGYQGGGNTVLGDDDSAGYLASSLTFDAVANTKYLIVVDGHFGAKGDVVLSWNEIVTAQTVPTVFTLTTPVNILAPGHSTSLTVGFDNGACDWFLNGQATAVTNGTDTIANAGDAQVGTYSAHVTTAGGTVSLLPDFVELNQLEDGTTDTNSVAWGKFINAAAAPYLQPTPPAALDGDTRGYTLSQAFSTATATSEQGEPIVCAQRGGHPTWYAYTAPAAGNLAVSTSGSSFNTILGVFVGPGTSFATLTNVGCGYTMDHVLAGQPQVVVSNALAHTNYYIVVDGENGAAGTAHLNINFGKPVAITAGPQSTNVIAGSNATFSATATGSLPVSYFWQNSQGFIARATNASYTVTNVQTGSNGTYTLIISNGVSLVTTSVVLGIIAKPNITNQPAGHTNNVGATVSFTLGASGTTPFSYSWFLSPSTLKGTNSSLSLTNIQLGDSGNYFCVVTNPAGKATSIVANLTVQMPPAITTQPISHTVTSNTTASLTVAASGSPSPGFTWFFNKHKNVGSGATLNIASFQPSNEGPYLAVATNAAGAATSATAYIYIGNSFRFGAPIVSNGAFVGQMVGTNGSSYIIQASANLSIWTPILTSSPVNGLLNFTDTNTATFPHRLYRAVTN